MIRLKMKSFNMILTEKLQKYRLYHQAKLINTNISQMKNLEQAKITYSPLGKAFEKQIKAIKD